MMCRAAGPNATVECPLKPLHPKATRAKIRPRIQDSNLPEAPDRICSQSSVAFDKTDGLKQTQVPRFQSDEWRRDYRTKRNTNESIHGMVKDSGFEELDQPQRRRIRGFAAKQLLVAFLLVSTNLRKIHKFRNQQAELEALANAGRQPTGEKPTRRRDREGHSNYRQKWPLKHLPEQNTEPAPPDVPPTLRRLREPSAPDGHNFSTLA